jgi:mycothiol synthase
MELPAGYRLRRPTPGDLDVVAGVLIADELDGAGQIILGVDFVRDEWSRVGFDLAADAWVVADGAEAIVGYAQAMRQEPAVVESWGVVHPAHRGRGLGSSLLDLLEERASRLLTGLPSGHFRHAINASDHAAAMMLQARRLRPVRHFWNMQIDLTRPCQPGPAPAGVEITGIESPGQLPAVHAILDKAFADHWGHRTQPFDRWAGQHTGSPSYDPALWLLATSEGQPAGALIGRVWDDRGWVDYLGVLPPCRGRGIGAALLRRSFAAFAGHGARRAILNVDAENTTGATALYERAGMRVINRWDLWERLLSNSRVLQLAFLLGQADRQAGRPPSGAGAGHRGRRRKATRFLAGVRQCRRLRPRRIPSDVVAEARAPSGAFVSVFTTKPRTVEKTLRHCAVPAAWPYAPPGDASQHRPWADLPAVAELQRYRLARVASLRPNLRLLNRVILADAWRHPRQKPRIGNPRRPGIEVKGFPGRNYADPRRPERRREHSLARRPRSGMAVRSWPR